MPATMPCSAEPQLMKGQLPPMFKNYRCPSCGGPLHYDNTLFRCAACQIDFPIIREIPLFSNGAVNFRDPAHETEPDLSSETAGNTPPGRLVKTIFDNLPSDVARAKYALMFFVEMQAGWKYLTDLSHANNALIIGSGTGISSLNLRRSFSNVFVMDPVWNNLLLVQRRRLQKGIENFNVVAGGDTKYLPFPTGFFDLICVNSLFEQVPLLVQDSGVNDEIELPKGSKKSAQPLPASGSLDIQINFLNEVNRILKSNGTLYLATGNRFYYRNFIAPPGNPTYPMPSSPVPRRLAGLFSFLTGRSQYYARSYPTLRKILKRCNFEHLDFYSLKPDHRLFHEILFFDKVNLRQTNGGSTKDKIKNKLYSNKYLCPSFGIVAGKDGRKDNFIQTILRVVTDEFGKRYVLNRYHTMLKGNVVLDLVERNDPTSGFMVKIAIDDVAEFQNSKNYDMLSRIHNNSAIPEKIKGLIPRPCGKHVINGQTVYLEDKMRGLQASRAGTSEAIKNRILNNALDFIVSLHEATLQRTTWDEADYTQSIGNLIDRVRRVGEKDQHVFDKIDTVLRSSFIGTDLSLAHKHGDYSVANILVDPIDYTIRGIIDWDNAEQHRPILVDLVNLIESSYNNYYDLELGYTVTDILLKNNLSSSEKSIVRQYASRFGCPEDSLIPYTLLYWLFHFDSQLKYNYLIQNPEWMRDNYYNVLAEMKKLL
jgi:SAM-dependent methyltransferase